MASFYKMHDSDPNVRGMIRINKADAPKANEDGFGIFWTVNSFHGERRIENLAKVDAWAIDMDSGTKEEMITKIKSGLIPTMVVETKRGYHVYFKALDANPEHWNAIVLDRLVPFYGADKNARDLARVLRVPGYKHLKNPSEPFLITKVWEYKVQYSEKDIAYFFQDHSAVEREAFKREMKSEFTSGSENLWDSIWRMDCFTALQKLSGTDAVGGEEFSFRKNSNGNYNIFVNGKGTSCWIDQQGRIGSLDKGGPTPYQWINYYQKNKGRTLDLLQKHFPELPWNKKS